MGTTGQKESGIDLGDGAWLWRGALSLSAQSDLVRLLQDEAERAGWLSPVTPGGRPFSVKQMNFGPLGWVSDARGYRYEAAHPVTGAAWPALPEAAVALWRTALPRAPDPECGLLNLYVEAARMGLHVDADEDDRATPILTLSLGWPARFRLGGMRRSAPTRSVRLASGDVLVMSGASRNAYHGVDRILSPDLTDQDPGLEGRLSLTLRRVTRPGERRQGG